ncbi:MAG: 3-hydroxyacyl-CoA dehydrogenase NAD-binding domain-containing protein, partial [Candidatus Helarchaeota archaeon]
MKIQKVCVLGSGTMGAGIAQLIATNGYEVNLVDVNEEILKKALSSIKTSLERFFVAKNKMTKEEAEKISNRIKTFVDRKQAVKDVQLV